jgi:hypothetical protein
MFASVARALLPAKSVRSSDLFVSPNSLFHFARNIRIVGWNTAPLCFPDDDHECDTCK